MTISTESKADESKAPIPIVNGLAENRVVTDRWWLCVFLVFLAIWIGINSYALASGQVNMFAPTDSDDRTCGVDTEVRDAPNVLVFDVTNCLHNPQCTMVCVRKCPRERFVFTPSQCLDDGLEYTRSRVLCQVDVSANDLGSCDAIEVLVGLGRCARWYLASIKKSQTCIPHDWNQSDLKAIQDYISEADLRRGTEILRETATIFGSAHTILADVSASKIIIVRGLASGAVVSLIMVFSMQWIATPIVWISMVFFVLVMAFSKLLHSSHLSDTTKITNPEVIYLVRAYTLVLVACCLVVSSVLILLWILRKQIVSAMTLINSCTEAITSAPMTIAFLLLPWICQITCLVFFLTSQAYILALGEHVHTIRELDLDDNCACSGPAALYKEGSSCMPDDFGSYCSGCTRARCAYSFTHNPFLTPFTMVNILGYIWSVYFFNAISDLVLSMVFGTWHYTQIKPTHSRAILGQSIKTVLRFHGGTAALGSLVLSGVRLFKRLSEELRQELEHSEHPNAAKKLKLIGDCFDFLVRFMKYLTHNSYIICGIRGTPFVVSTLDAFDLINRNKKRFIALNTVAYVLFFVCRLLVVSTVGLGVMVYLMEGSGFDSLVVPVVVVMVGTFFISSIFLSLYSMAVDTLFVCFLLDFESINDPDDKSLYVREHRLKILERH